MRPVSWCGRSRGRIHPVTDNDLSLTREQVQAAQAGDEAALDDASLEAHGVKVELQDLLLILHELHPMADVPPHSHLHLCRAWAEAVNHRLAVPGADSYVTPAGVPRVAEVVNEEATPRPGAILASNETHANRGTFLHAQGS